MIGFWVGIPDNNNKKKKKGKRNRTGKRNEKIKKKKMMGALCSYVGEKSSNAGKRHPAVLENQPRVCAHWWWLFRCF